MSPVVRKFPHTSLSYRLLKVKILLTGNFPSRACTALSSVYFHVSLYHYPASISTDLWLHPQWLGVNDLCSYKNKFRLPILALSLEGPLNRNNIQIMLFYQVKHYCQGFIKYCLFHSCCVYMITLFQGPMMLNWKVQLMFKILTGNENLATRINKCWRAPSYPIDCNSHMQFFTSLSKKPVGCSSLEVYNCLCWWCCLRFLLRVDQFKISQKSIERFLFI